ncbi:PepSY-associated TM helix domain-containing protein [Microbulbifer sp. MLAF003]|uniref:PepSY-associated TM helix domain-containing protein n=1 Tax=Microbulbifer sp. MLAF003 TaxID=3032582 RepID=UPI0024AE154B|nr:PepSY-associated TM helix domain-containing protein [Microbulbifer sp. MLAF003]WHI49851.1 PepSY-associated TM helix domain-containing protein [Microbulbifer sp. MLAF003]
MKLSFKPTPAFVRNMTDGHSVLGLAVSTLLYIVCVSGTLAVFYNEFERWEQASELENLSVAASVYQTAAEQAIALAKEQNEEFDSVKFTIPNTDMPRLVVEVGDIERYVAEDGALLGEVKHEWTHFLAYLHFALNLPLGLGVPLVGLIGVLMAALIVSGLLAHPKIIKDAFSFRLSGSKRLQQVDLHNRLGVWASPFHLAIAITGAFIGLSQVAAFAIAGLFYDGDTEKVEHILYREHPVMQENAPETSLPDFAAVLAEMERIAPEEERTRLEVAFPGREGQVVEIWTRVPERLVWGERYHFNPDGSLIEKEGWSEGDSAKQVYLSTFRLHFGHFSGFPVKIAYFLLGIGMCVLVVSGINIWLVRKRQRGAPAVRLERVWMAQVWGIPFAIALSAVTYLAFTASAVKVFWLTTLSLSVVAAFAGTVAGWSILLRVATIIACLMAVIVHASIFGADSFVRASLVANAVWLLTAAGIAASCLYTWVRRRDSNFATAVSGAVGSN